MRRGLALGATTLPLLVLTLASSCADEAKDEPRYIDASEAPDARLDARADRLAPCAPGDPACSGDAASDAPLEGGGDGGTCTAANACATARDIGSLSGDTNADSQSATGSRSEWLSVRVTENSTGVSLGAGMKASFTLTSPPGENFDLFVYYDPLTDALKCSPAAASSTQQAGISDSVSLAWGEGAIPNASNDSRTVVVEVRHASGSCDAAAKWSLLVLGNQ